MYDIVIKNGKIIDGTGSPYYRADIAVKDGKIAKIAKRIEGGERVIDATGLTVTPGFIDSHSHADNAVLEHPQLIEKAEQGITTSVAGQCGESVVPSKTGYATFGEFMAANKDVGLGSNLAILIGHSTLRRVVMGGGDRTPTTEEMEQMKALLRDAMEHGALGMSFGLFYSPGCYAKTDEAIELASVVGEYDGVVAAHIRDENNCVSEAVEEFITIVREAKVRGVISHHKSAGKHNWGKVCGTLKMIEEANEEGLEVYCDVYPYCASGTTLSSVFVPPHYRALKHNEILAALENNEAREEMHRYYATVFGEDLSWVMVTSCKALPQYQGRYISEIAETEGKTHYDAVYDIIHDSDISCSAAFFSIWEEDIERVMKYPRSMICTDSGVARNLTKYHPRLRATFPRVLGRYVRERNVTTLPEMIRKITAMPAMVYGFKHKGLLVEGYDADICIFDADTIIDCADYVDCHKRAEGLNYVLLGGQVVAENAVYTGVRSGKHLLRED